MRPVFSTEGLHPRDSFRRWREIISDQMRPAQVEHLSDGPFAAKLEVAEFGPLRITRNTYSAVRAELTHDTIQKNGRSPTLNVVLKLAGQTAIQQNGRDVVHRRGDLVVLDQQPTVQMSQSASQSLFLQLPRERLEGVLGPARRYAALTVGAHLASTTLVSTFIQELIRVGDQLNPEAAARMAAIGGDLIVAGIAERMALEVPRPLHGTVVVQRAKAYVEANLGDPTLDPPHLAAAMGVSLRRLQELFHERGRHISDWIWDRRLAAAAARLSDPGSLHLSIGTLAYGCGFISQAHFARRFKARHGLSPTEYRRAAATVGADEHADPYCAPAQRRERG